MPPPSKTKIAEVCTVAYTLRTLSRGWLEFMAQNGLEVHVAASPGPDLEALAARPGVHSVHPVAMSRQISPRADLSALLGLFRLFRRERFAIVHASSPKAGLLAMVAASLARVPFRRYTIRGMPLDTERGLRRLLLWLSDWLAIRLAHEVIAVGPSVKTRVVELRMARPEAITVIGDGSSNGIDLNRFTRRSEPGEAAVRKELGIPGEAVVIGLVGRLTPEKGVGELAEAWARLRSDPNLHLLLVGETLPGDRPLPSEVLAGLRVDERVHMVGYRDATESYYEAMDILAVPTYREGFPNVFLEAAAMSIPSVGTEIPGCRDAVVADVTGLLVPPRDAEALTRALDTLISDTALRLSMGKRARERVERSFSRETIWAGLIRSYMRC